MGGEEFTEKFRTQLDSDLEDNYNSYKSHNESKNIFKAFRTPAVFFTVAVFMYILGGIFGLFGLYTFANLCSVIMFGAMLTLALWGYIRYSGELSEFGIKLDELANYIWDGVSI